MASFQLSGGSRAAGGPMAASFAVLHLSGCAGCEVSLLNATDGIGRRRLDFMPLVLSSDDLPEVDYAILPAHRADTVSEVDPS